MLFEDVVDLTNIVPNCTVLELAVVEGEGEVAVEVVAVEVVDERAAVVGRRVVVLLAAGEVVVVELVPSWSLQLASSERTHRCASTS